MFTQDIKNRIDLYEKHENVLERLKGLIDTAKQLHSEERKISLLSVRLVGLLVEQNGAGNSFMNQERFAYFIGLTPNQFWKRNQTFRVLKNFPEFGAMIERGETCASHVALLSNKITEANAKVLGEGIKNKSTREVRDFVASVAVDGTIQDAEETFVDLRLRLNKTQLDILERAREVLAHGGHVPSTEDLVMKALSDLVDRRDPVKKAERVLSKVNETGVTPSLKKDGERSSQPRPFGLPSLKKERVGRPNSARPKIPAKILHKVWQRDQGFCTHQYPNDHRCGSRMMLEVDHIVPWAKGGTHSFENLALKCRAHNQWSAVQVFGAKVMNQYKNSTG